MKRDTLNTQERLTLGLRELYQAYGYSQYKVGTFEEYDLYARNKKFLESERVLTFSDQNGTLLALKPDVTLSIVKNAPNDGRTSKVCYTETVYRVPKNATGFREILQTGLECIGRVDAYARAEVIALAAKSLGMISERYVLDISDIGVLSGILAEEQIGDADCARLLAAVGEKNQHGLTALCDALGVSAETQRLLKALVETSVIQRLDDGAFALVRDLDHLPLGELYECAGLRIPLAQARLPDSGDAHGCRAMAELDALRGPLRERMQRSVAHILSEHTEFHP